MGEDSGIGAAVFDVPAGGALGLDAAITVVDCAEDCGKPGDPAAVMLVGNVVCTGVVLDSGGEGAAETDVVVVETA